MKYLVAIVIPMTTIIAMLLLFQDRIAAGLDTAGKGVEAAMQIAVWTCAITPATFLIGAAVVLYIWAYRKRSDAQLKHRTATNGYFPLQSHKVQVWDPQQGKMITTVAHLDPNQLVGSSATYDPYTGQFVDNLGGVPLNAALETARQRNAVALGQSVFPSDDAYIAGNLRRPPTTSALRAIARETRPEPLPRADLIGQSLPALPAPKLEPPPFMAAWLQSTPTNWKLGWNPKTDQMFDLDLSGIPAVGTVGMRGAGKTTGAGMFAIGLAVRYANRRTTEEPYHRYHPVILDPKGTDLKPFAKHAEYVRTDVDVIGDQLAALVAEHDRRRDLLAAADCPDILDYRERTGRELPKIILFLDEYGDLWQKFLRRYGQNSNIAREVAGDLATLVCVGRATGFIVWLIDQSSELWERKIRNNISTMLAYPVGDSEVSFLHAWALNEPDFPERGSFVNRNTRFDGWLAAPSVLNLLPGMPPSPWPRLLESKPAPQPAPAASPVAAGFEELVNRHQQPVVTLSSDAPAAAAPVPAYHADDPNRFEQLVSDWFADDDETEDSRRKLHWNEGTGASEVARLMYALDMRMAPDRFRDRVPNNYKSLASQMLVAYRRAHGGKNVSAGPKQPEASL